MHFKRLFRAMMILAAMVLSVSCGVSEVDTTADKGPSEAGDVQLDAPDAEDTVPGPYVLNLDDPGLYQYRDKNFSTHMNLEYEGSTTGFVDIRGDWFAGAPPSYRFTFDTSISFWGGVVPFTYVGLDDALYLVVEQGGCSAEAGNLENPYDDYFINGNYLTGEATLVESGVMINGTVTDRYEVTHENLLADEGSAFYDFEFVDTRGSVYVDRVSQVIVRIDQAGTGLDSSQDGDGSGEIDLTFQLDFEFIDHSSDLALPEDCEIAEADPAAEEFRGVPADIPFPVLDDASNVSIQADMGIYEYDTMVDLDEIAAFYTDELIALGYTLDYDLVMAPTALLQFSSDQGNMTVSVTSSNSGNGSKVSLLYAGF